MSSPPDTEFSRYLAPAAFLVAVVALVAVLAASGVLGGRDRAVTRESTTSTREISLGKGGTSTSKGTTTTKARTTTTTAAATATTRAATTTTGRAGQTYVVKAGDSPVSIAESFGVSVTRLMEYNNISDALNLRIGQTLRIPPSD